MQGRIEADMEIKRKIDKLLIGQPDILRMYVDSLSENAWNTKHSYVVCVESFFKWILKRKAENKISIDLLKELLPLDINAYMSDMQYITDTNGIIKESSSSRRMQAWSALYSFFYFLTANGFVAENIVSKTRRPKNKDLPSHDYLTEEQIIQLIDKVENSIPRGYKRYERKCRDILIIKLFLTTGIRAEPLREINIEDIDFKNKTVITINKGHKTKVYKILDSVMEAINNWLPVRAKIMDVDVSNQTGPLFISSTKNRLNYCTINNVVKHYTSLIGIEGGFSCHKLRHSYGTIVYMTTKDINYTKEAMGHEDIGTTQRYVNEIDSNMDEKLDNKLSAIMG